MPSRKSEIHEIKIPYAFETDSMPAAPGFEPTLNSSLHGAKKLRQSPWNLYAPPYVWKAKVIQREGADNGLGSHRRELEAGKRKVKEKWGQLTDDDLIQIDGKREQLEARIQQQYGQVKNMVRKDVDDWLSALR